MASNSSTVPPINLVPSAEWSTDGNRISGRHTGHQIMDIHTNFCGNAGHGINTNRACNRASDRHGPSLVVAWTCMNLDMPLRSVWLPGVVWPMDINIASDCSTNHRNLHGLSWQHSPWASAQTHTDRNTISQPGQSHGLRRQPHKARHHHSPR